MAPLHLPPLTLDGTATPLDVDPEEVERFYIPLAQFVLNARREPRRLLVGVAGPPASGKSVLAAIVAAVINALAGAEISLPVGLDGWHYPNSYLDSHSILKGGQRVPLRKIKGAPDSFDAASALDFLRRLSSEDTLPYPVYSRVSHDPVPSATPILPSHRVIFFEGNYLFLQRPPWSAFFPLFDLTIFVSAPRAKMIAGLRERHLRSGKDPSAVDAHIAFSDLGNLDLILSESATAAIRVDKWDSRSIKEIIYPHLPG